MTESTLRERDTRNARAEFKRVVQEWSRYIPPWRQLYPALPAGNLDCIMDLMRLKQKPLLDNLDNYNKDNSWVFGFLPLICKSLVCQLGALCAQSFAERMILAGNLLVTKQQTLLNNDLINMIVVLQMNRNFMKFLRATKAEKPPLIAGITSI